MGDNVIIKDNGDAIGYYADLSRLGKKYIKEAIDEENWDNVEVILEIQRELEPHKNCEELLVLSENNGMGYTVSVYKGEK